MKKTITGILSAVMAAVILTATASGAEYSDSTTQEQETQTGSGTYCKNAITGETYFIPEPELETYSDETFGYSPGYNPFADNDKNNDSFMQPYYLDFGRTLVTNPQYNEMCRNTVFIVTRYTDGLFEWEGYGTGFLIGPNAVATAGHLLYDKNFAGDHWISESTIYPAINKGSTKIPFGSSNGIGYRCGGAWADSGDLSDDWGIIILDSNIGDDIGWLGLHWQSASYSNTKVWQNGYPSEVDGKDNIIHVGDDTFCDQYIRSGTVNTSTKKNMLISTNMFGSHGDSGGPCYVYLDEFGYTAIGIYSGHTQIDESDANISSTMFRTIDQSLYKKLVEFRTSTLK